jgi:hypothetical protein
VTDKTVVPEEAVEAAARAIVSSLPNNAEFEIHRTWATGYARAALEAAAPFIAAKALEDAADKLDHSATTLVESWGEKPMSVTTSASLSATRHDARMLRARAAAVRGEG